jgi:DNA helicase-2/ATP-dependent DNA helicase PcrA
LPDVVADAVVVLGLDVETMARAHRTGGVGVSHLDRLVDEAAQFADLAPQAGLREFLDYLDAGAEQERGLRRAAEVYPGSRVQLLTVHAAKGLEWDVVAIAGLTEGGFPTRARTSGAWLTDPGTLPYPLRGDAAALPTLDASGVETQSHLATGVDGLVDAGRSLHLAEERRLMYVAATRARRLLLCHGYRWGDGQRALDPSRFLDEMADSPAVDVTTWVDDPGEAPDPTWDAPEWPRDPLGRHRRALESGAALVRDAVAGRPAPVGRLSGRAAEWELDVRRLLAERDREGRRARAVRLPTHLSATQLVTAERDPGEMLDRMRRPMPMRPRIQARQGTAFHAWVEQYYGRPGLLDIDELPGAADATAPPPAADLHELREAFLASPWAAREPIEVEAPFEMVVEGVVVRGRADAVFADGGGIVVVDWKTGPPPRSTAEATARSVQLAVYRQAFASLHGLADTQVRAVFHHVRENVTIEESGLAVSVDRLLRSVTQAATS